MMLVSRAHEVLEGLRLRENVGIAPEEQRELQSNRLISVSTSADYEKMRAAAREVHTLTQSVRDLSRRLEAGQGPVSQGYRRMSKREKEATREEFQHALGRLEDAVGKKAAIETLVYNPVTGSYVSLALAGRKLLSDMSAWKARFGSEELEVFLERMTSLRRSMELSVGGALQIVEKFTSPRPGMIKPELRAPALIASQSGLGAEQFESLYSSTPEIDEHEDYQEEGELFMSAFLSSSAGGHDYLVSNYRDAYASLIGTDLAGGSLTLKAAALAGAQPTDQRLMIERMRWLKQNMVLPDENDIVWLARSEYPLEEIKSRYERLNSAVVASGHQENSDLRTACSIMAGSPHTVEVLLRRYGELVGQLKYVFDAAYVAAAMLASGYLEPGEAIQAFKEAVGVISRANFFDDAGEVENLALLITSRIGPDAQGVRKIPEVEVGARLTSDQAPEERRRYRPPPWYYYYYWHNRYYGRPMYSYYRSHPGHMHTVPHFG